MNIHDTTTVVMLLAGFLALVGFGFVLICRMIAKHHESPLVATVAVAAIVTSASCYWLGLIGLSILIVLVPAWLWEHRRWRRLQRGDHDAA